MNKLKQKIEQIEVQPSAEGWNKLSESLDAVQPKKENKRKLVPFYWSAAAVVLLCGILLFNSDKTTSDFIPVEDNTVVNTEKEPEEVQKLNVKKQIVTPVIKPMRVTKTNALVELKETNNSASASPTSNVNNKTILATVTTNLESAIVEVNEKRDELITYEPDNTVYFKTLNNSNKLQTNLKVSASATVLLHNAESELDIEHKNRVLHKMKLGIQQARNYLASRNLEQNY